MGRIDLSWPLHRSAHWGPPPCPISGAGKKGREVKDQEVDAQRGPLPLSLFSSGLFKRMFRECVPPSSSVQQSSLAERICQRNCEVGGHRKIWMSKRKIQRYADTWQCIRRDKTVLTSEWQYEFISLRYLLYRLGTKIDMRSIS